MNSVLLSSASMFTQNVYKRTLRKQVCVCVTGLKNRDCVFIYTHLYHPADLGRGAAVGGPWQPAGGGLGRNGSGLWWQKCVLQVFVEVM